MYLIGLNYNDKKIKVKDSKFTIPLDYFIRRKDEYFEYKIYYQEKELKSNIANFESNQNKISGTSPKYKKYLAIIEKEQKKREMEEGKESQASNQKKGSDKENENQVMEEFIYENNIHFPDLKECDLTKGIEIKEKRGYKDACRIGSSNTGYSNGVRFNKQIFFFCISKYDNRKTGKGISFFHNSDGEWGKDKSQVSCLTE